MSERLDRCPTCRCADVDQTHAEKCAIRTKARADAIKHGRDLDKPIHGSTTEDLWAHFNTRTDPETARDLTRVVIDLGWRPVIGKYDRWPA